MGSTKDFLRGLATHDRPSLQAVLTPGTRSTHVGPTAAHALDRETRMLVQLAALLASDAGTASLRWAVDRASAAGADDATLVRVLLSTGSVAGNAQAAAGAARLALAMDLDLKV